MFLVDKIVEYGILGDGWTRNGETAYLCKAVHVAGRRPWTQRLAFTPAPRGSHDGASLAAIYACLEARPWMTWDGSMAPNANNFKMPRTFSCACGTAQDALCKME